MTLSPFIYDQFVTGKNFVGRRQDVNILGNLLSAGENVVIYAAPKAGKTSLVQQTFMEMKVSGKYFITMPVHLLGVRTTAGFLQAYGDAVLRSVGTTPDEYRAIVSTELAGTCFVFDQDRFSSCDEILSFASEPQTSDIEALVALPLALARKRSTKTFVVMDEFQNIGFIPDSYVIFRSLEKVMKEAGQQGGGRLLSFVISGSMLNAMKDIFLGRHYLSPLVELYSPSPLSEKEISDHIVKGLLSSGKVIEEEMLSGICRLFRNNIWYIEHFVNILDHLSKGYVTEPVLTEALRMIVATHEDKFRTIMNDLTNYQVSFLKAVLDGHVKFSSAEVIRGYGLNSSANVKRLREALMKKEILTFDEKDHPVIIDPLFEYWVRKYFFRMELAD